MAEPQRQASSGRGIGGTLKAKMGPLPLWGWLLLMTAVAVGFWLFFGKKKGSGGGTKAQTIPEVAIVERGRTNPPPAHKPRRGEPHRHHRHRQPDDDDQDDHDKGRHIRRLPDRDDLHVIEAPQDRGKNERRHRKRERRGSPPPTGPDGGGGPPPERAPGLGPDEMMTDDMMAG